MESAEQSPRRSGSVDHVGEVIDGVRRYARQETVEPIKGAARWVAVGTLGSLCLGLSTIFVSLGALRLVQDVGGTLLDGGLSFVPYIVSALVLLGSVALAFSRINRTSLQRSGT